VSDFQQHGQRQGAGEFSRLGLWYVITGDRKGQFRSWEVQGDQGLGWCAAWSRVPECAADGETEWLLLWDAMLGRPPLDRLGALVTGRGDVFHAGLGLGLAGLPKLLSLIWPTWMLGADADPAIESSSWRLSLRACLLRAEVLRQMGWLRGEFDSLEAAGLELGLRYLQGGVILRHTPALVPAREPRPTLPLPWLDEVRLAATAAGRKWAAYAVLRAWQKGWCRWTEMRQAFALLLSAAAHPEPPPAKRRWRERPDGAAQGPATVSVLIPTLDRYPYLETLLDQLSRQTVVPHQVIVVDQTPKERRRRDLQARFPALPLVWIEQDEPGQCSSRNEGLRHASGEWVLFLDDDVEVPENLIEQHLRTATAYQADAVSGVVTEPGQRVESVPSAPPRLSSVFPAGNSLLRRACLVTSGPFDLTYNHGQRADGDLGMRLYLSGALLILDAANCVLHHHAPKGGLRTHKSRIITRAASKRSIWKRSLPSAWDFYFALRFFGPAAAREKLLLATASTLTCAGNPAKRVLRMIVALGQIPSTWYRLTKSLRKATQMLLRGSALPKDCVIAGAKNKPWKTLCQ